MTDKKENRFYKTLFVLTEGGITLYVHMEHNIRTQLLGVYSGFRKSSHKHLPRLYWKPAGKSIRTELPEAPKGLVHHHVAYDFKRPEAFIVDIPRSLHVAIHNPTGREGGRLCIE